MTILTLILNSCAPVNSIHAERRLTLLHTYSICIVPADNSLSQRFVKVFAEELRWEQYLYVADNCTDADSMFRIRVHPSFSVELEVKEKDTGNRYRESVKVTVASGKVEDAARLFAHHLWEILDLPPEVQYALPYGDVGDPSAEAVR